MKKQSCGKYYRFEWTIDGADGRRIVDGNVGFRALTLDSAHEFVGNLFLATDVSCCVWTHKLTCGGDE